jgi:hypothetical protein
MTSQTKSNLDAPFCGAARGGTTRFATPEAESIGNPLPLVPSVLRIERPAVRVAALHLELAAACAARMLAATHLFDLRIVRATEATQIVEPIELGKVRYWWAGTFVIGDSGWHPASGNRTSIAIAIETG